jgi:hypothetical protein
MPISIMFAALAALAGCATANYVTYSAINSPPRALVRRDPGGVDIFVGKTPARSFVEVGLFQIDQGLGKSTEDMLATLRLHAGLRGCDAVQVIGVETATYGRHNWEIVRGVCDVYTDAQAEQAANRIAVFTPLAGEGAACNAGLPEAGATITAPGPGPCPSPLLCTNKACASPYR